MKQRQHVEGTYIYICTFAYDACRVDVTTSSEEKKSNKVYKKPLGLTQSP
jgi:hypothetical protein